MTRALLLFGLPGLVACSGETAPPSARVEPPAATPIAPRDPAAGVTITGTVRPATSVEVVFRSAVREDTVKSDADGKYRIVLAPGAYHVFVRDDVVMSVGRMDRVRLPAAADEALMPLLVAERDADAVELAVVRAGIVTGTVVDVDGRAISGAVVSAHGAPNVPRPVLGTDVAVSRADGSFELRLPDGEYQLAATHDAYADSTDVGRVDVKGGTRHVSLTLVEGCIVSGRVIAGDGKPAGEGAIEKRFGFTDLEFAPNGRSDPTGRFRWTTTDEIDVVLRAWPWHRPPSPSKRFACRDGARFATTFVLPERMPDLSGVLTDRDGAPVPFAHLDVQPLDPGGLAQQERTDEHGRWAVYLLPPGRYAISAVGRGGVVAQTVASPAADVRLVLSGTGRIEGTTTHLANGSFDLALGACLDGATIQLPRDPRLVTVVNGRFAVDDVPACDLQLAVDWRGEATSGRTVVPANGTARLQLDLGVARTKLVTGVVRDRDGRRVAGAHVAATYKRQTSSGITDEDGRFTLDTFAGATVTADRDGARGETMVGLANVASERIEIVLASRR